jgi:hypothetical protein
MTNPTAFCRFKHEGGFGSHVADWISCGAGAAAAN